MASYDAIVFTPQADPPADPAPNEVYYRGTCPAPAQVTGETLVNPGNWITPTNHSGTLAHGDVIPGSVEITWQHFASGGLWEHVVEDDGQGVLNEMWFDDQGEPHPIPNMGTINYATGAWTLNGVKVAELAPSVTGSYQYDDPNSTTPDDRLYLCPDGTGTGGGAQDDVRLLPKSSAPTAARGKVYLKDDDHLYVCTAT